MIDDELKRFITFTGCVVTFLILMSYITNGGF